MLIAQVTDIHLGFQPDDPAEMNRKRFDEVVESLLLKHGGRFRALRKSNGGLSSVRNRGLEETTGRYLVFLDSDDEMAPGALAALSQQRYHRLQQQWHHPL